MEEFLILHHIPNQKNTAFSIQVVHGDVDLIIIYCRIKHVVLNDTVRSERI